MISIELIFPERDLRLWALADTSVPVGVFREKIRHFFGIKNGSIFFISSENNIRDDMTLKEAGLYTGAAVVIEDEQFQG